jgi:hypothetical protein
MGNPVLRAGSGGMFFRLGYAALNRYPLTKQAWTVLSWDVALAEVNGSYDLDTNAFIVPASGDYALGLEATFFNEREGSGVDFDCGLRHTVDGTPTKDSADGRVTSHTLSLGKYTSDAFCFTDVLTLVKDQIVKAEAYVGDGQITFRQGSRWAVARVT